MRSRLVTICIGSFSRRAGIYSKATTDLLLTFLDLHTARELSVEMITAGNDSSDGRCSFDTSRARVGDVNSDDHGGLLLQPRHAILVQLVANGTRKLSATI